MQLVSQSITQDFLSAGVGEGDLVCSGLIRPRRALAEGGVPTWRQTHRQCCPVVATRAAAQSLESCPFCRGAGDHRDRMVHGGPRAGTDRHGVDPILDDGGAVCAGRFFESGVAVFFATSSA